MSSAVNEAFADERIDFAGIASRYSPMLYRVALRRLRNAEDAEDAVQDALLSAYKHIGEFEGRSRLSSWLVRIVINAARMKLRTRRRYDAVSLDQTPEGNEATLANELADVGPDPETICAHAEMEERLHKALAQISPKLRVAFHMREISEFSAKETADALRITSSSLKSRLKRARAAVRLASRRSERNALGGSFPGQEITIRRRDASCELAINPTLQRRRKFHAEPRNG